MSASNLAGGEADDVAESGLLVVIVNYRTATLAVDAMESLVDQIRQIPGSCIAVVDNASADGSATVIADAITRNHWDDIAFMIETPRNGGFSYGNNMGIGAAGRRRMRPQYVLLLNPDTHVHPGCVHSLVSFMNDRPNVGIIGARIVGQDGCALPSAFNFHCIASEFERAARLGPISRLLAPLAVSFPPLTHPHPVDWVSGACMMVRARVFRDIGHLDEGYFLYYEETDLCLHARRAGWQCWYAPEGTVTHFVSKSTGLDDPNASKRRVPSYWFHSRRYYFEKNHGGIYATAADLAFLAGLSIGRWVNAIRGKPIEDPPALARDFVRCSLQRILTGRRYKSFVFDQRTRPAPPLPGGKPQGSNRLG